MFLRMRNLNTTLRTLCDVSGSQEFDMVAEKREMPEISMSRPRLDRIEITTASAFRHISNV